MEKTAEEKLKQIEEIIGEVVFDPNIQAEDTELEKALWFASLFDIKTVLEE